MGDQRHDEEQEDALDANISPLDHLFSALKNFARATDSRGPATRAGKTAEPRGAFGAPVKKSCCLSRRSK